MKDDEEWEKDCCITCIAIKPGARKVIKETPSISPLSLPIANERTSKNKSDEEHRVWYVGITRARNNLYKLKAKKKVNAYKL